MKNIKKKIVYFLQMFDGIWSVPLAFGMFWVFGVVMTLLFGDTTGVYDMAFMQPLFLAAAIVIGASNIAVLGLYFTFRGIYKHVYGFKNSHGVVINKSKEAWEDLKPLEQIVISFSVFFLFFFAVVMVYLKMI